MAQKQGSTKTPRKAKTSIGVNGGGGKVQLNELQKVLLVNGGMAHRTRRQSAYMGSPKRKGGKNRSQD